MVKDEKEAEPFGLFTRAELKEAGYLLDRKLLPRLYIFFELEDKGEEEHKAVIAGFRKLVLPVDLKKADRHRPIPGEFMAALLENSDIAGKFEKKRAQIDKRRLEEQKRKRAESRRRIPREETIARIRAEIAAGQHVYDRLELNGPSKAALAILQKGSVIIKARTDYGVHKYWAFIFKEDADYELVLSKLRRADIKRRQPSAEMNKASAGLFRKAKKGKPKQDEIDIAKLLALFDCYEPRKHQLRPFKPFRM